MLKVKVIVIELEDTEKFEVRTLMFKDGQWIVNGPVYSRVLGAMHETWRLWRTVVQGEKA